MSLGYKFQWGRTYNYLYVRGTNLTDEEARDHLSFLKEVLPLPGPWRDGRVCEQRSESLSIVLPDPALRHAYCLDGEEFSEHRERVICEQAADQWHAIKLCQLPI